MREQAAQRVRAFSRYNAAPPSLYPNQAAPYGSFPYVDPTPAIWDSSPERLRQDVPADPKYQGWDFNQEPIADTSAISNVPFVSDAIAGPTVNKFTPVGSDYTPQQLNTPINELQQQNIPSNVIPLDPTGGLAATDSVFTGMPSVFTGPGTQVAQVGGIPSGRTFGVPAAEGYGYVETPYSFTGDFNGQPRTDVYSGSDPGLETVTPLFDALTMGTGIKGAIAVGKVLSNLDRVPSTHSLPGMRFSYRDWPNQRLAPFSNTPAWRGTTKVNPVTPASVLNKPAAQIAVGLTPDVVGVTQQPVYTGGDPTIPGLNVSSALASPAISVQATQEEADARAAEYMAAAADTQDIMMAGGTLGGGMPFAGAVTGAEALINEAPFVSANPLSVLAKTGMMSNLVNYDAGPAVQEVFDTIMPTVQAAPAQPSGPSAADIQRDKQAAVDARNAEQARQDAINAQMAIEMAARQRQQQQAVAAEQARQAQAAADAQAASAAQAQAAQNAARAVLASAAGRDRGGPSDREINAAIEVLSGVDTFASGGMMTDTQRAMTDVGYGGGFAAGRGDTGATGQGGWT